MRVVRLESGRRPSLGAAIVALNPLVPFVTVLSSAPDGTSSALGRWIERRQLRRSRLVFAPTRADAVDAALRCGVSPTRFRVLPADRPANEVIAEEIGRVLMGAPTGHSA